VVRLLLAAKADAHAADHAGDTALSEAAFYGHAAVVEALLAAEADAERRAASALDALGSAVRMGRAAVVATLLGQLELDRALRDAVERGELALVQTLLGAGADADAVDEEGRTALMVECSCRPPLAERVRTLLGAGAAGGALRRDGEGRSARELAEDAGASEEVLGLLRRAEEEAEERR
jgi:ankyrin repeat protein